MDIQISRVKYFVYPISSSTTSDSIDDTTTTVTDIASRADSIQEHIKEKALADEDLWAFGLLL